jgi:predicted ester cyclase
VTEHEERVALVNEHMRLENGHDFPGCIGTFHHARYEIVATGEVFEGPGAVGGFLEQNRKAFPDFVFVPTQVSGGTAVLVEGRFTGTHQGKWRGLPPTDRRVDFPMALVFEFDGDRMVNERVYFDMSTTLQQLGVGESPFSLRGKVTLVLTHPLVITTGLLRELFSHLHRGADR